MFWSFRSFRSFRSFLKEERVVEVCTLVLVGCQLFAFLLWGRVWTEEVAATSYRVFSPPGSSGFGRAV
jgi:hypothetical protein